MFYPVHLKFDKFGSKYSIHKIAHAQNGTWARVVWRGVYLELTIHIVRNHRRV